MTKSGVLLLNLGGPDTQADVQPFLYNLFADPELIRLPSPALQPLVAWLISNARAEKSRRNYAAIGGGSPLRKITVEQAQALQAQLVKAGYDIPIYVAMRYWHPRIESVVHQIKAEQITDLVVLPLYPQYSISTTGSSFKLLAELWQRDPELAQIRLTLINSWYDQPDYVNAMAASIREQLDHFEHPDQVHVLFSAHGIPESYVTKAGDPYQQEMEACVKLIWKHVDRPNPHTLSYQSRVGSVKWLGPYTEDVIPALGADRLQHLLVVPISFISEHIETLQEIDIEYRELAHHSGIPDFRRVPALNSDPGFITALRKLVEPHLIMPTLHAISLDQIDAQDQDLDPAIQLSRKGSF